MNAKTIKSRSPLPGFLVILKNAAEFHKVLEQHQEMLTAFWKFNNNCEGSKSRDFAQRADRLFC